MKEQPFVGQPVEKPKKSSAPTEIDLSAPKSAKKPKKAERPTRDIPLDVIARGEKETVLKEYPREKKEDFLPGDAFVRESADTVLEDPLSEREVVGRKKTEILSRERYTKPEEMTMLAGELGALSDEDLVARLADTDEALSLANRELRAASEGSLSEEQNNVRRALLLQQHELVREQHDRKKKRKAAAKAEEVEIDDDMIVESVDQPIDPEYGQEFDAEVLANFEKAAAENNLSPEELAQSKEYLMLSRRIMRKDPTLTDKDRIRGTEIYLLRQDLPMNPAEVRRYAELQYKKTMASELANKKYVESDYDSKAAYQAALKVYKQAAEAAALTDEERDEWNELMKKKVGRTR